MLGDVFFVLAMAIGVMGVITASIGIPLGYRFKKQKLIRETETNKLALAYQILSARPELTMDDVLLLMNASEEKLGGASQRKLVERNRK